MQFSLKAQPVRPAPEVVEVELVARVFDDADHVVEVCRTTGLELEENQVFGTDDRERKTVQHDSLLAVHRRTLMLVRGIDDVERILGVGTGREASHSPLCHGVGLKPLVIDGDAGRRQLGNELFSISLFNENEEIKVLGGSWPAPGSERHRSDQAVWNGKS